MLKIQRLMYLVILIVLMATLECGHALYCKKCANQKCDELEDETCPVMTNNQEAACLTQTYKDDNNMEVVDRKCVAINKGKEYKCDAKNLVKCEICKKDYCNSSAWKVTANLGLTISLIFTFLFYM